MAGSLNDQLEFDRLDAEFKLFVTDLQREWLASNKPQIKNVAPVAMTNRHERENIESTQSKWRAYITPIAEEWWLGRGYKVIWPDCDTDPVKYERIENST